LVFCFCNTSRFHGSHYSFLGPGYQAIFGMPQTCDKPVSRPPVPSEPATSLSSLAVSLRACPACPVGVEACGDR
jgi:hypothetical protein